MMKKTMCMVLAVLTTLSLSAYGADKQENQKSQQDGHEDGTSLYLPVHRSPPLFLS